MTREEFYGVWAPPGAVWTPWAKAVLFSQILGEEMVSPPPGEIDHSGEIDLSALRVSANTAVVLDLPGSMGVDVAIELAHRGYRPVPLYNAIVGPMELVDVASIARALRGRTEELAKIRLPFNAAPAFMLDVNRRGGGVASAPGRFDNRSICFPTDFPSAAFLSGQGIDSVLLVTLSGHEPEADLSHTMLRWQQAGLRMLSISLADGEPARPIVVARPSQFRALWYNWLELLRLRRGPLGGFGGLVPFPGSGGAFG
jgi:hypothetical protein